MGKMKASTRCNIISLRICRDDYQSLEKISLARESTVSDLMREALQNLITAFRESRLDGS